MSADSLNLGSRNPITGAIEGFDIDMINAVAEAIFGDRRRAPNKVELRVISSPQRIPVLKAGTVDIVARNMTINCARWQEIAFSAEYYRSGQKTLVQRDSTAEEPGRPERQDGLRAGRVDQPGQPEEGRTRRSMPITADTDTGCLVLFQQGKAYGDHR